MQMSIHSAPCLLEKLPQTPDSERRNKFCGCSFGDGTTAIQTLVDNPKKVKGVIFD